MDPNRLNYWRLIFINFSLYFMILDINYYYASPFIKLFKYNYTLNSSNINHITQSFKLLSISGSILRNIWSFNIFCYWYIFFGYKPSFIACISFFYLSYFGMVRLVAIVLVVAIICIVGFWASKLLWVFYLFFLQFMQAPILWY